MFNNRFAFLLLVLLSLAFLSGLVYLFQLRFERGDIFPPYSSLRTDPLGAKAFYASLSRLENISVTRHFKPLSKLEASSPQTIFYLGLSHSAPYIFSEEPWQEVVALAQKGNRIILSFRPEYAKNPSSGNASQIPSQSREKTGSQNATDDPCESSCNKAQLFLDHLPDSESPFPYSAHRVADYDFLPNQVPVHSTLVFSPKTSGWKTLYARKKKPVIVQQHFDRGSVIVCIDSYMFSNEGLRDSRQTSLLSWLAGNHNRIVFDEAHFGIREQAGVMALIKRYQLHWLLFSVGILFGLLVWKHSVPFVLEVENSMEDNGLKASEHDQFSGFINLLRRSVPPRRLLSVCYSLWKKDVLEKKNIASSLLTQDDINMVEHIAVENQKEDIVERYRQIANLISERKVS